jgi:phosphatidylglycerophosphatase A
MTPKGIEPPAAGPMNARQRVMLFVGSLGYLGFVPAASGTVAVAVVGVPLYLLLAGVLKLGLWPYVGIVVALTAVSIWVAGETDRILNEQDSKRNVIDELPGFLIAMIGLPLTWKVMLAAFLLERAIDIVKVWPADWVEDQLPRGWGVVMDDVVAGVYTMIAMHIAIRVLPGLFV